MSIRLVEQTAPFLIPSDLKEILMSKCLEYGTGAGVGEELPAVRFWNIQDEDRTVGYVWLLHNGKLEEMEPYINMAVLPQHQRHGFASFALATVEMFLAGEQVPRIYCQVNSNKLETGLRVRQWLLRRGFELLRRDIPDRYRKLSNTELARTYTGPVCFFKRVFCSDAQQKASGDGGEHMLSYRD